MIKETQPNGYVTIQELDDIIKIHYPLEFKFKDIIHIIEKF